MALITAAEAREAIPSLTGTGEDTLLATLITAVGAAFARYLRYPEASAGAEATLESTSYTLYLDGPGGRDLTVPVWPLTAVSTIEDDPELTYDGSTYLVPATDYAIADGRRGLVRLDVDSTWGHWSTANEAVKIVCTAGWSTVPAGIKAAAKLAVRHLWDLRARQGRQSVSQGDTTTAYRREDLVSGAVELLLAPYMLPGGLL